MLTSFVSAALRAATSVATVVVGGVVAAAGMAVRVRAALRATAADRALEVLLLLPSRRAGGPQAIIREESLAKRDSSDSVLIARLSTHAVALALHLGHGLFIDL